MSARPPKTKLAPRQRAASYASGSNVAPAPSPSSNETRSASSGLRGPLDRDGVELGRDLDPAHAAAERSRPGGAPARRGRTRCRAPASRARARAACRAAGASPARSDSGSRASPPRRRSSEGSRQPSSSLTAPDGQPRDASRAAGGSTPSPPRLHVLSGLETGLLWGNLGVSLLVIVAGAMLVPALSLPDALVAIVVGCVIGNAMLAVAGMIGADARVPGMALMRAPLGQRGSLLPTGVNVLQGIGWTIFELLVIATAAAALSDELFGFRAQWLWTLVFGVCALVLALLGPIGFVRRFIRRFAIWAVPLALLYLTWWALDGADLERDLERRRRGRAQRLAGRRRRRRDHGLMGPVCGRLHALLEDAPGSARRHRARLLRARRLAARARRRARALARPRRPGSAPGCRRRGRLRRDRRAVRAARDGDRRGVRERLLGGGLAPERRAARAAEAAHRARHRRSPRRARSSSTS